MVVSAFGLTGEPLGLFGQMLRNSPVEPELDLGGQVHDFECHSEVLVHPPLAAGAAPYGQRLSDDANTNIGYHADRFQYLLFNIT